MGNIKNEIYKDYEFDEEDDIILPDTLWGEIVYIYFIIADIIKDRKNHTQKLTMLKRQIRFFACWMKNK